MDAISLSQTSTFSDREYPITNVLWRRFLVDNYRILLDTATAVTLSSEEMQAYRFRLVEWLATKRIPNTMLFVVMLLNNFTSSQSFDGITTALIPSMDTISRLYAAYKNTH